MSKNSVTTILNRASKFDTNILRFSIHNSVEEMDILIKAIYRQVLGNCHIMESEKLVSAESQLCNGDIAVKEFIRILAKSELYMNRFYSNCTSLRSIELNFKHLLGRAPENYEEVQQHIQILAEQGYNAEIDSYLDSDEYFDNFGTDIVPYTQGNKTQTGKNNLSFTNLLALQQGSASSDLSAFSGKGSVLGKSLIQNTASQIKPLASPYLIKETDINKLLAKIFNLPSYEKDIPTTTEKSFSDDLETIKSLQNQYESFEDPTTIELLTNHTEEEAEIAIRAIYRQVFGNAHIMESERLISLESQVKSGNLSVREFVRALGKSELYRSRFVENNPRYRSIELNFKHLLGRAPYDYSETFHHSQILDQGGWDDEIDSYIDSNEYQDAFGENIVPYTRGYKTQTGQKLLGFTNMFKLLTSVSTSDKAGATGNSARTLKSLINNNPNGTEPVTNIKLLLADVLKPQIPSTSTPSEIKRDKAYKELQSKCEEQRQLIESLQKRLADLRPFASIGTKVLGTWKTDVSSAQPNFSKSCESIQIANSNLNDNYEDLEKESQENSKLIDSLKSKIADAQRVAVFGERRLNKWRSKVFS